MGWERRGEGVKQSGINKKLQKRVEEEKTETQKVKANKILLFSCNQSLFGGSATGSWSNVVRIREQRGKQVRKKELTEVTVCVRVCVCG